MKTFPSALNTRLAGELTTVATCWLSRGHGGAQFAFTEHDQPITVAGVTYLPEFSDEAAAIRTGSEMKLDTLEGKGTSIRARLPTPIFKPANSMAREP